MTEDMNVAPLHRITLKKPENLGVTTKALVDHGYTPWSFWFGDDICVQFHALKTADLDFLRPHILPPKASNQDTERP